MVGKKGYYRYAIGFGVFALALWYYTYGFEAGEYYDKAGAAWISTVSGTD